MVYALKDKKYFQFTCVSKTEEEFKTKIDKAYWGWRSCQSRSASEESKREATFLESYIKVKITIERYGK